jgi:hypothetical protein
MGNVVAMQIDHFTDLALTARDSTRLYLPLVVRWPDTIARWHQAYATRGVPPRAASRYHLAVLVAGRCGVPTTPWAGAQRMC